MRIRQTQDGSTIQIAVEGDLDMYSAPDLLAAGLTALEQSEADTLVLDLAALDFTDSTGLRTFVGLHSKAGDERRDLVLTNLPDGTLRLLQLTGLDSVFTIA